MPAPAFRCGIKASAIRFGKPQPPFPCNLRAHATDSFGTPVEPLGPFPIEYRRIWSPKAFVSKE
ncbi:hypothetical protein HYN69_00070 [Gemmobacter aquarius]|uniref:Uncharacterized protein n=1 Tax=Paragemmobacter aquarius TaxID=2169400 RepID=A0A2S0UH43_9RHOB|nr:hypothetical protein HYN69_00070 [Gemmobacter aquarius]